MAQYSLAQLQSFSQAQYRYLQHENQNKAYAELAKREKQAVLDKTEKATKDLDAKVEKHFYDKGGIAIHIVALVIAAVILIGSFTFFNPTLSFYFKDVLQAYDNKIAEDYTILPSAPEQNYEIMNGLTDKYYSDAQIEKSTNEYMDWRYNECELLTGGTLLLTAILLLLLMAGKESFFEKITTLKWAKIMIFACIAYCLAAGLVFICRGAWNDVHGFFAIIGAILNTLLMIVTTPFGAVVFIFRAGYVMALPFLLIAITFILGDAIYLLALNRVIASNQTIGQNGGQIAKWLAKKKEIVDNCPQKAEAIYKQIRAKITPNPYKAAYDAIPADIRNELTQLIWAIEKGYARDFVGARQFLQQQKNHKELMEQRERHHKESQRQAASIQRSIESQTQAIRDAANKEVEVYFYY